MHKRSRPVTPIPAPRPDTQDPGLGTVIGRANEARLLNRDGSFNARRQGLPYFSSLSAYHVLLTMSWPRFFLVVVGSFLGGNALFAIAFMACGADALTGPPEASVLSWFGKAFFFSVHTLATIGYGNIAPASLSANLVVTVEALAGLLGFALWTGLLFARFARPAAAIIFSRAAVVAPYRDTSTAFMFRIVNGRSNQLVELEATVLFSYIDGGIRRYAPLALERSSVVFFPLSWTIVHPIDDKSPFHGRSAAELEACDVEIMILVTGTDETFSQTVHARSSYKPSEIVFDHRFVNVYNPVDAAGIPSIDVRRLHDVERVTAG
jgi:inward rectifier potassium channel